MKPKALVLQAHGSNRDLDVMEALTLAGADAVGMPLNELRARKSFARDFQLAVIPGGFSYADALGAGKLLAIDLISYFSDEITAFVDSGKPVIGICNGFQALVRSGILPGNDVIARSGEAATIAKHPVGEQSPIGEEIATLPEPAQSLSEGVARNDMKATLTFNAVGHFECRWVTLKPISQVCIWTKGLDEMITCPVAHGEGNFQTADPSLLSSFQSQDRIALAYVCPDGTPAHGDYPANPNGSALDIAGLCNSQGNVLGLMPHPENHIFGYQHPRHTRGEQGGSGLALFENGVKYANNF